METIGSILISIITGIFASIFVSLLFYTIQNKENDYKNLYRCMHCYFFFKQYINEHRGNKDVLKGSLRNLLSEVDELGKLLTVQVEDDIKEIAESHWKIFNNYLEIFTQNDSVECVENFCSECEPLINSYSQYKKNIFKNGVRDIFKGRFGKLVIIIIIILIILFIIA